MVSNSASPTGADSICLTETVISPETFHRRAHGGLHDVVARIGGDEFVILLDDFANVKDAVRVAESGIHTQGDMRRLRAAGFEAFLIGESLMRESRPGGALAHLLRGSNYACS